MPQWIGTATRGRRMAAARAAASGSMCPGPSDGPQPQTGSSAASSVPAISSMPSYRSVSPAKYTRWAPVTTKPIASASGASGWRRPSCTAGTAATVTPSISTFSPAGSSVVRAKPRRRSSAPAPIGAITATSRGRRRIDAASRWSRCRCETRTAWIPSAASGAGVAEWRRRCPTRSRSSGSVSRRTPPTSISTVACPSQVRRSAVAATRAMLAPISLGPTRPPARPPRRRRRRRRRRTRPSRSSRR